MPDASASSPEETLAWEAQQRPRAALLALVAGNFTLFGGIAASLLFADFPAVSVLDGIRDAAGLPLTVGEGLRTAQIRFYDDHVVGLLLSTVVLAIGSAAIAGVLGYLFRATAARTPLLPRIALYGALLGPIMVGVAKIVEQVSNAIAARTFVSAGDFTTAAAHDALAGGVTLAAQIVAQLGVLLMAFSFVLVSLHAMRAGLLTRFMGILGMIVGGLFIIPLGGGLPVVQCFWLIAVGFLIIGRWPKGRPLAWETGRAEPWPTQQELREQRDLARGGDGGKERDASIAADPVQELEDDDAAGDGLPGTPVPRARGAAHPSSKKRKNRKRR